MATFVALLKMSGSKTGWTEDKQFVADHSEMILKAVELIKDCCFEELTFVYDGVACRVLSERLWRTERAEADEACYDCEQELTDENRGEPGLCKSCQQERMREAECERRECEIIWGDA